MSLWPTTRATLDDLARTEGKAELIGGRIVHFMATGFRPSLVAANIYRSLFAQAAANGEGLVFTDNIGYAGPELASGRESFSPDVSYYPGPPPSNEMDFIPGAPTLAIEVRSKGDYGDAAEAEMAAKRVDYFEAGTRIVWDVDPKAKVIRAYRAESPDRPSSGRASRPTPRGSCRAGGSPWMRSSPDRATFAEDFRPPGPSPRRPARGRGGVGRWGRPSG